MMKYKLVIRVIALTTTLVPLTLVAASEVVAAPPGASWTRVASMATPREGGGAGLGDIAAPLADGRVLYAGGYYTPAEMFSTAEVNYLAAAEIFNPKTGNWSPTGSLKETRFGPALVTLASGKVLAAGGYGGFDKLRRTAEIYEPALGTWRLIASMGECRFGPTASVLASGEILVVGGTGCNVTSVSSAEIFDPESETWRPAASMAFPRQGHSATTLPDGRILVAGGRVQVLATDTILNTAEIYDPTSDTWSITGSLSVARFFHASGLLSNGKVIVAGGRCPGQVVTGPSQASDCKTETAELYDPNTGIWSMTGSMTAKRLMGGSLVLPATRTRGERFLMAGGGLQSSAELYNPSTETWSLTASMGEVHDDAQLVPLSTGKILIAGGFDAGPGFYRNTAGAEVYAPPRS